MLLTVDYQQAYAEQTHMRVKRHRHHATKATTRPTEQRAPGTVNSWNDMGGGMTKLNPFRISRRQPNRDATRARVTATVVGSAAIFLGATSMMALVGSTSEATGRFSNANPPPAVRILATDAEDPSGKACEEQTWPYIESRCLKPADPQDRTLHAKARTWIAAGRVDDPDRERTSVRNHAGGGIDQDQLGGF